MKTDTFSFSMPIDVLKSSKNDEPEMRIAGYASTSDPDRQGETLIQKGLDISDFVNFGYLNYDHHDDQILGYPDKAKTRVDSKGFYVEGILLPSVPLAKSLWDTAVALKKSNAPRKLGFSVEGKALERTPDGKILKAKIYHVALTPSPVNTNATWDALVKSFASEGDANGDFPTGKAMTAGYTCDIGETNNGSCLKTESLDSAFKTISEVIGKDASAKEALKRLKSALSLRKSFSESELVLYYQLTKGLSRADSYEIVRKIMTKEDTK